MRSRLRVVALSLLPLLAVGLVLLAALAATPAAAQSDETPSPAEPPKIADEPDAAASEAELSREERKRQARQERIDAYLKKRDERRAEKEQSQLEREVRRNEAEAREIEKRQLAAQEEAEREASEEAAAIAAAAVADATPDKVASSGKGKREKKTRARDADAPRLPRALARAQANIRATELGLDPTVQEYLTLIDQQGASPHELAAFGSFIAQNGMVRDALVYYGVALRLAEDEPTLWINAGTLHLQTHDLSAASSAFSRALSIDPNNAVAHYNMGAVLDEMNQYEDAVAAYKAALTLDPALGDPTQNPQAANNDLLLAVRLMLYQERTGSLAVPLLDVTTGKLPDAIDESDDQ